MYCSLIHVLNLVLTYILVFMVGAEMRHFWHVVLFGFIGLSPKAELEHLRFQCRPLISTDTSRPCLRVYYKLGK